MILVDDSVLIEVIEQKPVWAEWRVERLNECAAKQALVINIVIYAEISRSFPGPGSRGSILAKRQHQAGADFQHGGLCRRQSTHGLACIRWLTRGNLARFFIGAHAQQLGHTLLTRDPVRITTYFLRVRVICLRV